MPPERRQRAGWRGVGVVVGATNKSSSLHVLTVCALSLPGLAIRAGELPDMEAGFQYSHYQESDERMQVEMFHTRGSLALDSGARFSLDWVVDTISGSSPVLSVPKSCLDSVSGATQVILDSQCEALDKPVNVLSSASIRDTRHQVDLGVEKELNGDTVKVGIGFSSEKDYRSFYVQASDSRDWQGGMFTLSPQLAYASNRIQPVGRSLDRSSQSIAADLGFTVTIDRQTLLHLQLGYAHERGFLSNPYKKVLVLGGDPRLEFGGFSQAFFERRPERRNQGMVLLHYVRHVAPLDAALHLEYRFHTDDWEVDAHSFELSWYQPVVGQWQVVPRLRYYSQNQAGFYRPFFPTARKDGHYSSDYRLAGFGSLSGGLSVEKLLWQKCNLHVAFEYYQHRAGL